VSARLAENLPSISKLDDTGILYVQVKDDFRHVGPRPVAAAAAVQLISPSLRCSAVLEAMTSSGESGL
jgi:hypothetical protein